MLEHERSMGLTLWTWYKKSLYTRTVDCVDGTTATAALDHDIAYRHHGTLLGRG
jgi:hypothetical protein